MTRGDVDGATAFWERHHASAGTSSDGSLPAPNAVLVDVVASLAPGAALDIGCGSGGDAFWLAQRGWKVTAVDVSSTALERVAARAEAAGSFEQVRTEQHDLSATFPAGSFDLVNAEYFHSLVEMDRGGVLHRAAAAVAPGGLLLLVDHASVPPWSWAAPDTVFPSPAETLASIGLEPGDWHVLAAEDRDREATGPGGQRATVTDTVIALVRRGAQR